jgi:uncharacterized membrane protein
VRSPTREPGEELATVVHRNIGALAEARRQHERRRTLADRAADAITGFAGSMPFVGLHALLFGAWVLVNSVEVAAVPRFDPFPFVMLAMLASVEAIFLSTFVLISQNRATVLAEQRADLDLQISLLAEHEVTRLIHLVDAIADRLGVDAGRDASIEELKRDVEPQAVLARIEDNGAPAP